MSKLSYFREDWKRAEIATSDYITPEDGQYRVAIEEVRYSETDRDGNASDPTFIYTFRIMSEKGKGQKFRRFTTIRNEKSASYFKGDLQKLGMPIPADPEDLPNIFMSAAGIILDLTVKTKIINGKDYKDIYFDKMVGRQQPEQRQAPQQFPPQPPQGYYSQPQRYQKPQQPQQQAFGGPFEENEEIPY